MKKKILFVCAHRPDRSPSQRFRFEQYIPHLTENGWDCKISFLLYPEEDKKFYQKTHPPLVKAWILLKALGRRFKDVATAGQYDLIFIQREAFFLGNIFFEKALAKRARKGMIFDFDDSIFLHQKSDFNPNRKFQWLKRPEKTKDIIKISSLIFAGNQYLADYSLSYNPSVVIIPTTIDTKEYFPAPPVKNTHKVCVGWSGSFSTVIHFETILKALKKIKEEFGERVEFRLIGDGNYVNEALELKGLPWKKETELDDLRYIDIGIMPLPDDEWAKGKCGLKGLQYMGLGIPTIMSPVGVNTEIIQDGVNGFLASSTEEWYEKIKILIQDAALRKKFSEEGRSIVEERYSIDAWKDEYLKLFNTLYKGNLLLNTTTTKVLL
ncbi:MAG TPA: glycosyltransferase family 4 protein [Cytophagaceae bacterium]|nr:glycosyltransferase family 4 protein [Cytophagaceae bacterium]